MKITLPLQKEPVAIIGMSGLFADSENIDAFWENIVEQADCIREVPASRWDIAEYYDPDPAKPDKTYSKVGGFIPDIDFDPLEYGLPPNILEVTDSSQILSLVMTKQALQDAGYDESRLTTPIRKNTGVILGVGGGSKLMKPLSNRLQYPIWRKVLAHYGLPDETIEEAVEKMKLAYVDWQENAFPGFLSNVVAGRIANRFDLGGTNCVVDAACAASLSAIKMAVQELVEHRCDMMISGGVDTDNSPMAYLSFSKTPAFSKKNQIRPFDADADGIVIGEGLGMVVMKRLADAERDGDTIYAVIKGIGSSSDGRNSSIYGPVSEGQQLAMSRAYQEAGYVPDTVGLVEAHGTGTPTGDRVEFNSISTVFKRSDGATQKIALGSVKSQIGHTKTAAGAASIIKASLALHHKVLPPTINIHKPNPDFKIEASPLYLNTQLRPWIQQKEKSARRAGVSAFGFGGTNFHITLEEYQAEHQQAYRRWSPFRSAVFHADNEEGLKDKLQEVLNEIEKAETFEPLSLPASIPPQACRLGFVYQDRKELMERLKTSLQLLQQNDPEKSFDHPKGIHYSPQAMPKDAKVAVLFSGQGSQYVNMGSKLACLYPEFRLNFQQADRTMQRLYQESLSDKVFPVPAFDEEKKQKQQQLLTETQYAQPAIGAISMSMYQLLSRQGFRPDMVGGHSFGELTALWAAGALKEEDYLELACLRGRVMAEASKEKDKDAGGMLAVKGDREIILKIIEEQQLGLDIANINAPDQVVLGGSTREIERAAEVFSAHQLFAKVLPVSAAFHTSRLQEAQKPLAEAISKTYFQNPELPVFCNIDGQAYPMEGAKIQQKFKEHMLSTVQFQQEIEAMYEAGARIFVEVGPGSILSRLVQSTLQDKSIKTISLNSNPPQDSARLYQQALTQLLVYGVSLNVQDPYQLSAPDRKAAKAKMKIPMNASNYLSEKTKMQWEKALQDSPSNTGEPSKESTRSVELNPSPSPVANSHSPSPVDEESYSPQFSNNEKESRQQTHSMPMLQQQIDLVEEMIQFHARQQDALEEHRRFLEKYKQQMNQIAEEQQKSRNKGDSALKDTPALSPALRETFPSFRSNGNGHHTPNGNGNASLNGHPSSNGIKPPRGNADANDDQKKASSLVGENNLKNQELGEVPDLEETVLSLIAEKTGYPAEMINLDMELVADLGIDSIKQVEIFGAMREQYPILQQWQTEDFAQIKSLKDIIGKIKQYLAPSGQEDTPFEPLKGYSPTEIPTDKAVDEQEAVSFPTIPQGLEEDAVVETLLAIVADKTGYPAEMIDQDMELVADLGVDSIKQVEILGAMREQYPVFREVQAEQLSALKKISDIKKLLQSVQ